MPLLAVLGMAVVLTAFTSYAMLFLSRSMGGGFVGYLADALKLTAGPLIFVTQQVVKLTSWLAHTIGPHFLQVEQHAVGWLTGMAEYVEFLARSWASAAYDLDRFGSWLLTTYLPKAIRNLPNSVTHVVHSITTRVVHVERTVVKLPGLTKAAVRAAVAVAIPGLIAKDLPYFDWLKKHLKALEKILAGAAGAVAGTVVGLPKDLVGIRKRLAKLERISATSLAAGAVALALARLGVSWVRCNNWKRLGRAGCNLDPNAITQLLGLVTGLALIEGNFSIVALAEDMLAIEENVVGLVTGAFSELDGIAA